jgi:lipoyl(octanoyl) transferase
VNKNQFIKQHEFSNKKTIQNHIDEIKNKLEKSIDSFKLPFYDLGLISYNDAFEIQSKVFEQIQLKNMRGFILLLEHRPVITIGSNRKLDNLLVSDKSLHKQNIELLQSNRGGDLTFHGPGQLVCYPVINLSNYGRDLTLFVWNLEQILISVLGEFGIEGRRINKLRGIFIENYKIASIGIHVRKWITTHGFSLNVNVDLKYFKNIIACGLKEYNQTSMQKILNKEISINDVKEHILENFYKVFKS